MANNYDSLKAFDAAQREYLGDFTKLDTPQGSAARAYVVKEAYRGWIMGEIQRGAPVEVTDYGMTYLLASLLFEYALNRSQQTGLKHDLTASVLYEMVKAELGRLLREADDISTFEHRLNGEKRS